MIERVYFKDNLSFKNLSLEFKNGLVCFSGVSGAGKSVIFKSILAAFAMAESNAALLEVSINDKLNNDLIDDDEINIFRVKKDKQTRYFINEQAVSKKLINEILANKIRYLSARNYDDFEPNYLLTLLDKSIAIKDDEFSKILNEFKKDFLILNDLENKLKQLSENEKKINDLRDFLKFEIEKIKKINPQENEYNELLAIKSKLSKQDKINNILEHCQGILHYESKVNELLKLLDIDNEFFQNTMFELNNIFYEAEQINDEYDIESILNRLEELNYIIKKYSSIENAKEVLAKKQEELQEYENIEENIALLKSKIKLIKENLNSLANFLHDKRNKELLLIEKEINEILKDLFLENLKLNLTKTALNNNGLSLLNINLKGAGFKEVSSGELNRLRLAFLCVFASRLNDFNGILFLDEIDANLSGKEAASIASVLQKLAKNFQIFAITHMPYICAKANQHILVSKINNESFAKSIQGKEVQKELARMISDGNLDDAALEFVKNLLEKK